MCIRDRELASWIKAHGNQMPKRRRSYADAASRTENRLARRLQRTPPRRCADPDSLAPRSKELPAVVDVLAGGAVPNDDKDDNENDYTTFAYR